MHIIKIFKVNSKMVNSYKQKFEKHFPNKKDYEQFIEKTSFEEIVQLFSKVCEI